MDIARQTLANESRLLLPQMSSAYAAKDRLRFEALARRWLQLMDLQDQLLAANRFFLVGTWLGECWGLGVQPWQKPRSSNWMRVPC